MRPKRYKPLVDKLFYIISVPTLLLIAAVTVLLAFSETAMLFVMIPIDLFVIYFLISPLFGYVELGESSVLIRYGFFMKREIAYDKIRGVSPQRKFYADSMLSLKNSFDHINIKYNTFDITSVSVVGNAELMAELEHIISAR
ncbi:MAG: PH domain-containing protein [Clostridia bacterium]|nr:PH domain-containing protein [Clostridia bacterium]